MQESDKNLYNKCSVHCCDLICAAKNKYYSSLGKKLNNPSTPPKTYWSIVNRLMGKKKIPAIPPIRHEGLLETNFERKADVFNAFFANQCTTWIPFPFELKNALIRLNLHVKTLVALLKTLTPTKRMGMTAYPFA